MLVLSKFLTCHKPPKKAVIIQVHRGRRALQNEERGNSECWLRLGGSGRGPQGLQGGERAVPSLVPGEGGLVKLPGSALLVQV